MGLMQGCLLLLVGQWTASDSIADLEDSESEQHKGEGASWTSHVEPS